MSLMMRSGLSGPSGIYSKPIKPACPSGNLSKMFSASSGVLALTMKTTPFPSVRKYHWSILPARYAFTVSCTSCGMIWARWAGVMGSPMKWEIARIFVVGTGGSGFCAEAAPSGVIGLFMAVAPYPFFLSQLRRIETATWEIDGGPPRIVDLGRARHALAERLAPHHHGSGLLDSPPAIPIEVLMPRIGLVVVLALVFEAAARSHAQAVYVAKILKGAKPAD